MKILVVGGLGFLGKRCLEQLNYGEVTVIGRKKLESALTNPNHTYYQLDIRDKGKIRKFIKQNTYSHLLYLAWPPSPPHDDIVHIEYACDTINFISAFGEYHPHSRIVVTGSIHEVGSDKGLIPDDIKFTSPSTLYGISKKYVYACLREIFKKHLPEVSFCWVRMSNIYGIQDHSGKLISQLISKELYHTNFELLSPDKIVDFVHVDDAAQGVISALYSNVLGPINIGSGDGFMLNTLQEKIREWVGESHIEIDDQIVREENLSLGAVLNISRAGEVLSYKPKISFTDGVKECIRFEKEKRNDLY